MLEGVNRIGVNEWEVPVGYVAGMRVPGRFFLSESLGKTLEPGAVQQLANVATLPGNSEKFACNARHPLGLWIPYRRCCRVFC